MSDPLPLSALSRAIHDRAVVQMPDRPTIIRDVEIGGPRDNGDRRLVLSVKELELLLEAARESTSQRCVIHGVGLRVMLLQNDAGHRWQHIHLLGRPVVPEVPPDIAISGLPAAPFGLGRKR